jgi:hemerythrin
MPLFVWKDEYSVDIEELDNHHKKLLGIVNSLYDDCLKTNYVGCAVSKMEELMAYTDYHFTAEEQYLRKIEFADMGNHISQHEVFRDNVVELSRIDHGNELELTKQLIVLIGNWLLRHVLEEDRKYMRCS